MFTIWVIFHTIICILLVVVVLMQSSKGGGLSGAFGGGGGSGLGGAVFGGRGAASFLSRATTVLAVVFMLNCGALAFMSSSRTGKLSEGGTSIVTEQAQREMERQAAQQQQLPMDSANLFQTGDTTIDIRSLLPQADSGK